MAPTATPPTLSVSNVSNATRGQVISLSSLVTIYDPSNAGYQQLELWDAKGTVGGGQFMVNSVAQTGGHEIDVSPANVANTVFDAGTLGGTDTLWARLLQNDVTITRSHVCTPVTPASRLPTSACNKISNATQGHVINLPSLLKT